MMKKVILTPLVATAALLGCQDQHRAAAKPAVEAKTQLPAWVGHYQGTTPCMGCFSRCDDCPGMAVALTLHENQTFTLLRESLSDHTELKTLTGQIRFQDASQQKIELVNVATRNLVYVNLQEHILEIREDQTGKRYQMQSDFILGPVA